MPHISPATPCHAINTFYVGTAFLVMHSDLHFVCCSLFLSQVLVAPLSLTPQTLWGTQEATPAHLPKIVSELYCPHG